MDKMLNLCPEKNGKRVPAAEVKCLAQQLAKVRAARGKGVVDRQATEDAVASKEVVGRSSLVETRCRENERYSLSNITRL